MTGETLIFREAYHVGLFMTIAPSSQISFPISFVLSLTFIFLWKSSSPEVSIDMMDKNSKIVIVGAGIFGLSTAAKLASEGYKHVTVVDRHMPPVKFSFHLVKRPILTISGSGWLQLRYFPCDPFRLR